MSGHYCLKKIYLKNVAKYSSQYVPKHKPTTQMDVDIFKRFLRNNNNILVLTGAGISTESGIPDYRSKDVGLYARSDKRPVQYQQFVKNAKVRQSYWARNYVAWPQFSNVEPNITHYGLVKLERYDHKLLGLITQNVDNLHFKAGSQRVIELHGSGYRVKCLNCNFKTTRHDFQKVLQELNPDMKETSQFLRPDGDVEISEEHILNFNVPACKNCNGMLMTDIVFFGDNVPKERVKEVDELIEQCGALLVLGSSLSVYSSYRIILRAHELLKMIFIVNIGETRGDDLSNIKINAKCGDLFQHVEMSRIGRVLGKMALSSQYLPNKDIIAVGYQKLLSCYQDLD